MIQVDSFSKVDLENLRCPMVVVYDHPRDYPQYYVARVFDGDKPTNTFMLKDTLAAVQEDIEKNTAMLFISRGTEDEPCIVGAWL